MTKKKDLINVIKNYLHVLIPDVFKNINFFIKNLPDKIKREYSQDISHLGDEYNAFLKLEKDIKPSMKIKEIREIDGVVIELYSKLVVVMNFARQDFYESEHKEGAGIKRRHRRKYNRRSIRRGLY